MASVITPPPKGASWFRAENLGPATAPAPRSYLESFIVVSACALVLYFMNRPAFEFFFLGEDFNAWTMYINAERDFIKAIFTPIYTFLRPSAYAGILSTQ